MMLLPLLLATSLITTPTLTAKVPTEAVPTTTSEIQKFREVIQEKVKAKLQEIGQNTDTNPKKGYLGTITQINANQITIVTYNNTRTITLSPDTIYLNSKSSKIKSTELKVGQEVLAIGILDEQNNLSAKRIIVTTPKSSQNQKNTIFGQVVDISTVYSLIALIPSSNKNTQFQIKSDAKNLQIISKSGEKLTVKDITKGKKIIVISTSSLKTNQTLTAEKIIVL